MPTAGCCLSKLLYLFGSLGSTCVCVVLALHDRAPRVHGGVCCSDAHISCCCPTYCAYHAPSSMHVCVMPACRRHGGSLTPLGSGSSSRAAAQLPAAHRAGAVHDQPRAGATPAGNTGATVRAVLGCAQRLFHLQVCVWGGMGLDLVLCWRCSSGCLWVWRRGSNKSAAGTACVNMHRQQAAVPVLPAQRMDSLSVWVDSCCSSVSDTNTLPPAVLQVSAGPGQSAHHHHSTATAGHRRHPALTHARQQHRRAPSIPARPAAAGSRRRAAGSQQHVASPRDDGLAVGQDQQL